MTVVTSGEFRKGILGCISPHQPKKFFLTVKPYTVCLMKFFKSFPKFKIFIQISIKFSVILSKANLLEAVPAVSESCSVHMASVMQ